MGTQELINTIIVVAGTLLAAIITGVVALIVQFVQIKRDGKTVDSISSDTTDMKPKVENINSAVNDMVKDIIKIEERNSKIDSMATEIEVFKRLKSETTGSSVKPEVLLATISCVLEENADLRKQHREDQQQIMQLKAENNRLQLENRQLESSLNQHTPTLTIDGWEP